jgi:hypothetical protein
MTYLFPFTSPPGGLHVVDADLLGWWLCERQCDSGGLNGRPEKQADVCYSWWILSSLSILGRVSWIDRARLGSFILECQDAEDGGISDRPGDMADIFHTYFGIAGLALLGFFEKNESKSHTWTQIDPSFALPLYVCQRLGLQAQTLGDSNPPPAPALAGGQGVEDGMHALQLQQRAGGSTPMPPSPPSPAQQKALSAREVAQMIDHTVLKPTTVTADVEKVCAEARHHGTY